MDSEVFEFPTGMPGFSDQHHFRLERAGEGPLHYLTSTDPGGPRFFVAEPPAVLKETQSYTVTIPTWATALLGLDATEDARIFLVLNTNASEITTNLLGPVVLNVKQHLGCQIVVEGYPVRFPLDRESVLCSS